LRKLHEIVTVKEPGLIELHCPGVPAGALVEVSAELEDIPVSEEEDLSLDAADKDDRESDRQTAQYPTFNVDPGELLFPDMAELPVRPLDLATPEDPKRQRLIQALDARNFDKVLTRVAFILQHYPDTRDDDISLLLRYYDVHQAEKLEEWDHRSLDVLYTLDNIVTIVRARQRVQNEFGLYVGTLQTRERRKEIAQQFYRYSLAKSEQDAEIRIYLDETKGEPGSRYAGVAGVCLVDWRLYESSYLSLKKWRDDTGWVEPLHASPQAQQSIDRHLALLAEIQKRRTGLLFVGHDVAVRALSSRTIVDLFVQMVMGCLEDMKNNNCLGQKRAVVLIKEADEGFDRAYGTMLETQLQQQIAYEYPDTAYLKAILARRKGEEVMLEVADMIAFGMQRRAMYRGWTNRDRLAEAVANVTGFENFQPTGIVYKGWYHS
jgi:hypothetical protein